MSGSVDSTGWDDPFLALCEDPAFVASLAAAEREWVAEELFVDAVRVVPDDRLVELESGCTAPSCRDVLEDAAGAEWARRMVLLEQLDPAALGGWEAEEYARLYASVAAHVAYKQVGARLAVAARCRSAKKGGADFAGVSLAVAEKVSPGTAELRIQQARNMVERLPDLVALLGAGEIGAAHVSKALEATSTLSLEQCLTVQSQIADRAPRIAPGQLGKAARRAAAVIDPADFGRRQAQARANRTAYVRPGEDGMAWLGVVGPATEVALAHLSLDEAARALRTGGDPRTLEQLRCDLALQRLQGIAAADGDEPGPVITTGRTRRRTKHGRPVKVVVHVDLSTLLHADDTPGEVTGLGPVPGEIARSLAGESNDWWRLVTDPSSGVCRDYGMLRKPGQDLTDLIVARDEVCMAPMCDSDVDDIDHAEEHQHGGPTTESNLHGLSEHCHTVKTDGGWQPSLRPDGSVTWTSPYGTEHTVRAKDHRLRTRHPSGRSVLDIDASTMPPGPHRDLVESMQALLRRPPPTPLPDDASPPF